MISMIGPVPDKSLLFEAPEIPRSSVSSDLRTGSDLNLS